MPPRDFNLRLQDIAEAIDRIFDYTASHSLESIAADPRPQVVPVWMILWYSE